LGAITGTLSNCGSTGSGFVGPYPLAVNPSLPVFVFVTNFNGNSITRCTLSTASGSLTTFTTIVSGLNNNPLGITIYGSYAYISVSNSTHSTMRSCPYDATLRTLGTCTGTGSTFSNNNDIVINGNTAYVANHLSNSVSKCTVSAGTFTSCSGTGGVVNNTPAGIAITPSGIAYITIDGSGALTGCTATGGNGFNGPGTAGGGVVVVVID